MLSKRLGLGEVLGGSILLAFATNLPEIAFVVTAAFQHNLDIATGNILGGNAFLPVLFLPATIISGTAVLPQAHNSEDAPRRGINHLASPTPR